MIVLRYIVAASASAWFLAGAAARAQSEVPAPAFPPIPAEVRAGLRADDPTHRIRAIRELRAYGDDTPDLLFAALQDQDANVRWAALATLSGYGGADLVPGLLAALPEANARMQVRLYWLLSRHADRRVWDTLIAGLDHDNPVARRAAAVGLAQVAQPGDEAVIARALRRAQPAVGQELARALFTLRTPAAINELGTLLKHDDPVMRQYAAMGLAQAGGPQAVQHLLGAANDPAAAVRWWAYDGISRHADAGAYDALAAGAQGTDEEIRRIALAGLGRIGDPRAVPIFRQALADTSPHVRRGAAEGLGMMDDPAARPELQHAFQDENAAVRLAAATGLLRLGDTSVLPYLIETLQHENRRTRTIAAQSLTEHTGRAFGQNYTAWKQWLKDDALSPENVPAGL